MSAVKSQTLSGGLSTARIYVSIVGNYTTERRKDSKAAIQMRLRKQRGSLEMSKNVWCDRCKEEAFPIVPKEGPDKDRPGIGYFRMGLLYPLSKVPRRLRRQFDSGTSNYACGNCILDLQDSEEAA